VATEAVINPRAGRWISTASILQVWTPARLSSAHVPNPLRPLHPVQPSLALSGKAASPVTERDRKNSTSCGCTAMGLLTVNARRSTSVAFSDATRTTSASMCCAPEPRHNRCGDRARKICTLASRTVSHR
jgi:hypothetical protein